MITQAKAIALTRKAVGERQHQLAAVEMALLQYQYTGEFPKAPHYITQPRWEAMIKHAARHSLD